METIRFFGIKIIKKKILLLFRGNSITYKITCKNFCIHDTKKFEKLMCFNNRTNFYVTLCSRIHLQFQINEFL